MPRGFWERETNDGNDYAKDLHKEDRLYEYNNTKDASEKILSHFYKYCSLRIAARPLGKYVYPQKEYLFEASGM